jgi:hypothetical protein
MSTASLTAIGTSIMQSTWMKVILGVTVMAMPKLLIKYRTNPLACLLLGPPPTPITVRRDIPLLVRCVGCGAAIPVRVPD